MFFRKYVLEIYYSEILDYSEKVYFPKGQELCGLCLCVFPPMSVVTSTHAAGIGMTLLLELMTFHPDM